MEDLKRTPEDVIHMLMSDMGYTGLQVGFEPMKNSTQDSKAVRIEFIASAENAAAFVRAWMARRE